MVTRSVKIVFVPSASENPSNTTRSNEKTAASEAPPFHCWVPYWKVPNCGMGPV
jgi:hypothetical protein